METWHKALTPALIAVVGLRTASHYLMVNQTHPSRCTRRTSETFDLLDPKDRTSRSSLELLRAHRLEDRSWIADTVRRGDFLILRLLLELHVEEPFVDLDARKASPGHGFLPDFTIPLTSKFLIETKEVVDLSFRLLLAARMTGNHLSSFAEVLLTHAFTGDHDRWRRRSSGGYGQH